MSLLIIQSTKDRMLIAADGRESKKVNGKKYVLSDKTSKLYIIDDEVYFTCGNVSLIRKVLEVYVNQKERDVQMLQTICREYTKLFMNTFADSDNYYIDGQLMIMGIVICNYKNRTVTDLSSAKGYNIDLYPIPDEEFFITHGHHPEVALKYILDNYKQLGDIDNILQSTYNHMADESIGGNFHVIEMTKDGNKLLYQKDIPDKKEIIYLDKNSLVSGYCEMIGTLMAGSIVSQSNIQGSTISGGTINVETDINVGQCIVLNDNEGGTTAKMGTAFLDLGNGVEKVFFLTESAIINNTSHTITSNNYIDRFVMFATNIDVDGHLNLQEGKNLNMSKANIDLNTGCDLLGDWNFSQANVQGFQCKFG